MLVNERKDPYKLRIPLIWDETDNIERRSYWLESRSDVYDELSEIWNGKDNAGEI